MDSSPPRIIVDQTTLPSKLSHPNSPRVGMQDGRQQHHAHSKPTRYRILTPDERNEQFMRCNGNSAANNGNKAPLGKPIFANDTRAFVGENGGLMVGSPLTKGLQRSHGSGAEDNTQGAPSAGGSLALGSGLTMNGQHQKTKLPGGRAREQHANNLKERKRETRSMPLAHQAIPAHTHDGYPLSINHATVGAAPTPSARIQQRPTYSVLQSKAHRAAENDYSYQQQQDGQRNVHYIFVHDQLAQGTRAPSDSTMRGPDVDESMVDILAMREGSESASESQGVPRPHDRNRKIRDAERKRQRREIESNDEAALRKAKNLAAKRRRLERETEEERSRRRARDAETKRARRQREDPEQRATRLARDSERMRKTRRLKKILGPGASLGDIGLLQRNGLTIADLDAGMPKRRPIKYTRQSRTATRPVLSLVGEASSSAAIGPPTLQRASYVRGNTSASSNQPMYQHHQITTLAEIPSSSTYAMEPPPARHKCRSNRPTGTAHAVPVAATPAMAHNLTTNSMAIISSTVTESSDIVTLHLTLSEEPNKQHILHLQRSSLPQRIIMQRNPNPLLPADNQQPAVFLHAADEEHKPYRRIPQRPPLQPSASQLMVLPALPRMHPFTPKKGSTRRQRSTAWADDRMQPSSVMTPSSSLQSPISTTSYSSPNTTADANAMEHQAFDEDLMARRKRANAERSRRRRAMETPQQRAERNRKTAERMRIRRAKLAEEKLNRGLMVVPTTSQSHSLLTPGRFDEIFQSVLYQSSRHNELNDSCSSLPREQSSEEQILGDEMLVGEEEVIEEDISVVDYAPILSHPSSSSSRANDELTEALEQIIDDTTDHSPAEREIRGKYDRRGPTVELEEESNGGDELSGGAEEQDSEEPLSSLHTLHAMGPLSNSDRPFMMGDENGL